MQKKKKSGKKKEQECLLRCKYLYTQVPTTEAFLKFKTQIRGENELFLF